MVITAEQRTALEELIGITARGRALGHEHDHPKEAGTLQELVGQHKALGARKSEATEAVDKSRAEVAELSAAIEKQKAQIAKKTAELNDGTGLTSRDLVNLQNEIAGHEEKISQLEDEELRCMEELESAEEALTDVETSLTEVTAQGRATQTSIKERKAELSDEIAQVNAEITRLKAVLPAQLITTFDANVAAGGPGAAILSGPNCQACGQEISGMVWKGMLGNDINETYECEECEAVQLRKG